MVQFLLVALMIAGASSECLAQAWPLSVEATVGRGFGNTRGEYRDNSTGGSADLLVAWRIAASSTGGWVVGGHLSMQGSGPVTLICIPASHGGCVPRWPDFATIGLLAGYETTPKSTIRIMVGPAGVHAAESAFGLVARVDFALPVAWHISLAGSARSIVVPSYRGDSFQLYGVGVGLRLR